MNGLPVNLNPLLNGRSTVARCTALWVAVAIIALVLAACGGTAPDGNGPPADNGPPAENGPPHDDDGWIGDVPAGVVATVTGITAAVDNPFGTFSVGLFPQAWYYVRDPGEEYRLATGTVSAAGQLSITLPGIDETQWEAATLWPFQWCGEQHLLPAGSLVVSDDHHTYVPPHSGLHRSLYMRVAELSGTTGPVMANVSYVNANREIDLTCDVGPPNANVDVRLRPGWNILVQYTVYGTDAVSIYYRTGQPPVDVSWDGPIPVAH